MSGSKLKIAFFYAACVFTLTAAALGVNGTDTTAESNKAPSPAPVDGTYVYVAPPAVK